jgi:hypothetical protein
VENKELWRRRMMITKSLTQDHECTMQLQELEASLG